jgi:RNA polymerase primary sigma factor
MPTDRFSSEQINDVIDQLAEMGINVVQSEETHERAEPRASAERKESPERRSDEAPASDENPFEPS